MISSGTWVADIDIVEDAQEEKILAPHFEADDGTKKNALEFLDVIEAGVIPCSATHGLHDELFPIESDRQTSFLCVSP
jgi:hypothetical protein